MNLIIQHIKRLITNPNDISSIATKILNKKRNGTYPIKAMNGILLFIKEENKIRRASDGEWKKYKEQRTKFFEETQTIF